MISFFISWLIPLVLVWDLYTPGPSRGSLCAGLAVGATLGGATLTPLGAVLAICGALIVGRRLVFDGAAEIRGALVMAAARVLPLPKPPPDNLPDTEVARARAALREARAALRAADE